MAGGGRRSWGGSAGRRAAGMTGGPRSPVGGLPAGGTQWPSVAPRGCSGSSPGTRRGTGSACTATAG